MSTNATPPTRQQTRQQLWLQTLDKLTHPQLPISDAITSARMVLDAYDAAFPAPATMTLSEDVT